MRILIACIMIFAIGALAGEALGCTMCNVEVRQTLAEQFWSVSWNVLAPFPIAAAIFIGLDRNKYGFTAIALALIVAGWMMIRKAKASG